MEDLNIKQLTLAVRTIAEEKNLPEGNRSRGDRAGHRRSVAA